MVGGSEPLIPGFVGEVCTWASQLAAESRVPKLLSASGVEVTIITKQFSGEPSVQIDGEHRTIYSSNPIQDDA